MIAKAETVGLFIRPPTEQTPHPTSFAVDLRLRPTAPQADRPWACRISAALVRPGNNGLATDMVDVERLTELGRGLLERLGSTAVLATVATSGGRRTWLVYSAGQDPAGVTATVRQAVRLSFAEQADYVPTVSVEHDPDWVGYWSMYPSPNELADLKRRQEAAAAERAGLATTAAAVAAWEADGGSPGSIAAVTYRLAFPTDAARSACLARAVACQFRPVPAAAPCGVSAEGSVWAELARDTTVDTASIHQVERWLLAEASRVGGRYFGWTAPAVAAIGAAVRPAA